MYDTYTIYNPPDVHWNILNATMSQHLSMLVSDIQTKWCDYSCTACVGPI